MGVVVAGYGVRHSACHRDYSPLSPVLDWPGYNPVSTSLVRSEVAVNNVNFSHQQTKQQ